MNRRNWTQVALSAALLCAVTAGVALFAPSCGEKADTPETLATKVSSRHELIGGQNSLGKVGDYLLQNAKIRLVVQDDGYNRGSGLFGGSLIDADLVRTNADGNIYGGNGQDTFGELFPAFFLEVIDPEEVSVVNDGSDGEAAVVEVSGKGGEFVTMLRYINQIMVNSYEAKDPIDLISDVTPPEPGDRPLAEFKTQYILEPGARHVRIESTLTNDSFQELSFPNKEILELVTNFIDLPLEGLRIPTGHVLGFGAVNDIFVPGLGYDLRWGLEDAYKQNINLPAFPGKLAEFVATSNPDGTSYGYFTEMNQENNFVCQRDTCKESCDPDNPGEECLYEGRAEKDDLLMLFYASGFGGVFTHQIPEKLSPNYCKEGQSADQVCDAMFGECDDDACRDQKKTCKSSYDACLDSKKEHDSKFTFTNYFVVGNGTISSILDEMYRVKGIETSRVEGRIHDGLTGNPVGADIEMLLYRPRPGTEDSEAAKKCSVEGEGADKTAPVVFSQTFTNSDGYFQMNLPPGHYCYRTHEKGRPLGEYRHFEVGDSDRFLRAKTRAHATIEARVTNASGQPIPAKMTVVGTHEYRDDTPKRHFLYDLEAGQSWRTSDFRPDVEGDPETRRYIEAVDYSSTDGEINKRLRPGTYTLYFSRGPEYNLYTKEVELKPGNTARVNAKLKDVVNTEGYLSGDFHMHAQGSIDSGLNYTDRVISIAAEDVEVVVSSDHNYVSDFLPYIQREGLQEWMRSVVGVELTTFEFGHFNAFPLDYEVGSVNRGSIKWQRIAPQQIFDELRSRGTLGPDDTIIQVNHPRDSILGYFSQFNIDGFTAKGGLAYKQESDDLDKLISAISMPNGNAFVRDCRGDAVDCSGDCTGEDCEEPDFESKMSWDFEAMEVFNGKRLELLRHFRVPYSQEEWPQEAIDSLVAQNDGDNAIRTRCCDQGFQSPNDNKCDNEDAEACPVREVVSEIYGEDQVLCDDGSVAYPGSLDDWYNMLNYPRRFIENEPGISQSDKEIYHPVTATGNSDSHHEGSPTALPPGHPRNYFRADTDDPQQMKPRELVEAMQNHQNIITNGPFAFMNIKKGERSATIGDEITIDDEMARIRITVRAADWVGADEFRIIANGEPLNLGQWNDNLTTGKRGWMNVSLGSDGEWIGEYDMQLDKDTWYVLEVRGSNNLFPIYPPGEIPRIPFDDIIGQIAPSLGFGGGVSGLEPDETFAIRPFAFTNPIWVVHDAGDDTDGEFTPPAPEPKSCMGDGKTFDPARLTGSKALDGEDAPRPSRLDAVESPVDLPEGHAAPYINQQGGSRRDVRTMFRAWGHSH